MKTLDFARQFIRFDKSSPITGPFQDEHYPFLRAPFEAADDIRVKRLVILKASSCLGTVAGQIINLKRIVCDVGDQKMVCQTDDDAAMWTKTRGKEWLRANADAVRLLSKDKYAVTNDLWQFRHKFLEISGPSIAAAQSVQVRYVQTDESHLDLFPPGRLVEFEKRMGARWDRQGTHLSTAPNAGKELDTFYLEGQQDEWDWRCPKCAKLFCPLDDEDARERFNDETIFHVLPSGDVVAICPHCQHEAHDTAKERHVLNREGDYETQNPNAPIATRSFQWSSWAAYWISWRELASERASAMTAAKLGNLKPHEDWRKKRCCRRYVASLPYFGEDRGAADYYVGDTWGASDTIKILTSDPQAGKADEGAHFRGLVTQWDREGNSRRLAARRVETFGQLDALQIEFGVKNQHMMVDSGWENRLIYRECGKRHWFCFRGSDATEILHTEGEGEKRIVHPMPYSQREPASGVVGEAQPKRLAGVRRGSLPQGWAWVIVGANPTLYGYLSALLGGASGRYFGIARDFNVEYTSNMPAFIKVIEKDKKTQVDKEIWRKVREDHWWDTEVMAMVVAARNGYFPLGKVPEKENPAAEAVKRFAEMIGLPN